MCFFIATIRIRTNDHRTNRGTNNRTNRKYTNSRPRKESTVTRRTSTAGDVQVSMLPDLSEMRANEQTAWEEVMQLKALPIPMCQKKEMKSKILVSSTIWGLTFLVVNLSDIKSH